MNYLVLTIQKTSICLVQTYFFNYLSQAEECFHQVSAAAAVTDCNQYTIMLCNIDGNVIKTEHYAK